MKKVNLGIIGAGRIGKLHSDNLLQTGNVNIRAITDPCLDEEWAASRGLQAVPGVEDILNDSEIDAVFILSPSTFHAEQIILAAKAGKHIFCEKPIALDPVQIKAALEVVKTAGVKLQIGFNRRFDPNFMHLKSASAAGVIGNLYLVKIIARDPSPPLPEYVKHSGGIFLDMTIHDFDMVRYLSGSEVEDVYAAGAVLVDEEIGKAGDVDTAITSMTMKNGTLALIDNSRQAAYGYDQRIELLGSKGSISACNNTATRTLLLTSDGAVTEKPLDFFLERYNDSFRLEVIQFISAVAEDRPVPVGGDSGLESILVGLAARKSASENRPIKIDEIRSEYLY